MHLNPCFAGFSSSFCCCGFIKWSLCLCYWFLFPCMWKLVQNGRFKDISFFFSDGPKLQIFKLQNGYFLFLHCIIYTINVPYLIFHYYFITYAKKLLVNFRVDVLWESFVFTCYFELLFTSCLAACAGNPASSSNKLEERPGDTPSPKWDKQRHLQTSSPSFDNKEPLKCLDRLRGSKLLTSTGYQLVEPFWPLLCYSNTNTGFATI